MINTEDKLKAMKERHPLKEIGRPDDMASMVYFLLSEESSWITGQIMHVDGGMSVIKK
jgi:NAD(P)-dependent dehydrogenase (short-subunit alcohol dehydrogenase family)